ncbi:MAG: hypothetical protein NUV69_01115 [Candidatus Curtissbacteria bacterium]|nr:hypothetical protein [Candidatus Curtissbacteria bacterium]
MKIKNIFAAVFEKNVLDELLELLDPKSVRFWGTEGTVNYVKSKGFKTISIVKGFDFDGRVKSLDRKVFIGILNDRSKKRHVEEMKRLRMEPIDLVIVDLYAPNKKGFPESMDIGGQALIRAAIKNYKNVGVAFDQLSIADVTRELKNSKSLSLAFRKRQAKKALEFIAQRTALEASINLR